MIAGFCFLGKTPIYALFRAKKESDPVSKFKVVYNSPNDT